MFDTERDDAQNVELDGDEIRYSAGLSLSWITAIGPLTFTFAKALNDEPGDDTQFFDFSLGQFFLMSSLEFTNRVGVLNQNGIII